MSVRGKVAVELGTIAVLTTIFLLAFPKRSPVVDVASGVVWSFIYYRYRLLLPLALSHAALGSAFYYGIFGQDLAAEWRTLLP